MAVSKSGRQNWALVGDFPCNGMLQPVRSTNSRKLVKVGDTFYKFDADQEQFVCICQPCYFHHNKSIIMDQLNNIILVNDAQISLLDVSLNAQKTLCYFTAEALEYHQYRVELLCIDDEIHFFHGNHVENHEICHYIIDKETQTEKLIDTIPSPWFQSLAVLPLKQTKTILLFSKNWGMKTKIHKYSFVTKTWSEINGIVGIDRMMDCDPASIVATNDEKFVLIFPIK